ncbi:MAG: TolC family protein [bacterium]
MQKKYFFIISIIIVLATTCLFSQDQLILTIDRSIDLALDKNPEFEIAEKNVKKAGAGIGEAYSVLLPQINGSVNFQKSWDIQENTIPNFIKQMVGPSFPGYDQMPDYVRIAFGLENTFTYGVNLSQPLFLGGAGIAGVKMAYAAHTASQQELESKKQNLIYNTADAFYRALLAQELVHVQEQAYEQAQANLDRVEKLYNVGSASGFDKMRAEVEVANVKPEVIAARNNYQSALTGLRTIIGLPKETKIMIKGELDYKKDELISSSFEKLMETALQNRPELTALNAQKNIAAQNITIARSQYLPKLYFSTDYSFLAMRNDYNFASDDFSKGFTSALSLQIPLFTGLKRCRQYQKARLDYNIVKDTKKQLHDGIAAEVELVYNKFKEAEEKYFSAKKSIDLAEEALHLANLRYEEGVATQLDVLNSQLALTRARVNYASALYEYQTARYRLRKVTGTLSGVL